MLLSSFLILTFAIFGHLLITRASLGFGYTLGIRHGGWHVLVVAHAIVGITLPILMTIHVGVRPFSTLRLGWQIYLAICVAAVVVGAFVLVLRYLHSVPQILRSNHTSTHNAIAHLNRVPAPDSFLGKIARLPGNELFRVDFRTVEVTVPRLAKSLDGISVLHLTDLHFVGVPDRSFFEWACAMCNEMKPDIATITGDIVDKIALLDWLPSTLGKIEAPLGRFFILGNHDIDVEHRRGPGLIRDAVKNVGWTYLAGRTHTIDHNGQRILVAGTELPWAGEHPPLDDTTRTSSALRILLAHLPQEVWWARRHGFDLALAGHLHGGQIRFPILGPIIGGRLASGLFHLEPTILHVGRGLGELTPLRYGCPPDVVKLVLRSAM